MSRTRKRVGKRLREPFGKAGLTVAIVALVMALVGGAYAAGGLTKSQEKQVKKIAKKYAGKAGPAGAAGTAGAQGVPGAAGAAGKDGTNGTDGDDGAPGTPGTDGDDGKPVIVDSFTEQNEKDGDPPLEPCNLQGGLEVEVEGSGQIDYVCNGTQGVDGEEGQPWTASSTLPTPAELDPGKTATLTGAWSFTGTDADTAGVFAPISFSLKLATALTETQVHYETETNFADFDEAGELTVGCLGTQSNPLAPSGHLCVYGGAFNVINATFDGIRRVDGASAGASKGGAVLHFTIGTGVGFGNGSFAVTG